MTAAPPPAPAGGTGTVGQMRRPLIVILLSIVTLGIYALFWYYRNFEDMKVYSGEGLGGVLGLLLSFFCGIIAIFLLPAEVGNLYGREGQEKPITGLAGFWNLIPIIGGIIWVFKVQGAINDFWSAHGGQWAGNPPS
jgi:hypothetical protein